MSVKSQITQKLHEVYTEGEVAAGQVVKGTNFDGVRHAEGWWFTPFNSRPLWLGKSKNEAFEIIDQIASSREY